MKVIILYKLSSTQSTRGAVVIALSSTVDSKTIVGSRTSGIESADSSFSHFRESVMTLLMTSLTKCGRKRK